MSPSLAHIARCLDLREHDIAAAVASRQSTQQLLVHLAACSAPGTGVAKVLLVFARMATSACEWIDGGLHVELVASGDTTRIDAATELGGGFRERLLPSATFHAPLEEFTRAVERVPHLIAPLTMRGKPGKRVTLSASAAVRRTSLPPPPIAIAPESLLVHVPALAMPRSHELHDEGDAPPAAAIVQAPRPSRGAPPAASEPPIKDVDAGWED
jgi:hypothetical protein